MRIYWKERFFSQFCTWRLNSKQGHYNHRAINLITVNPDNKNDNRLQKEHA